MTTVNRFQFRPRSPLYRWPLLKFNQELLWKQAQKALETANKIRPDDAEILMNYGYTLYLGGEIEKSVEEYKKSIQLKPDWDITYYNLALAYERLRKYDLAKQSYQKVSEINPNGPLNNKSINRRQGIGLDNIKWKSRIQTHHTEA